MNQTNKASKKVSKRCSRCEALPCPFKGANQLYLWFPSVHTLTKAMGCLEPIKLAYELMQHRQGLSICCDTVSVDVVLKSLATTLTPLELQDSQALLLPFTTPPQLHDFNSIMSLQRLVHLNQAEWLVDLLANNRLTTHFQPLVHAGNTTQIFGYEALLRGLDPQGNVVMPGAMFKAASSTGLLSQLDLAARRSAIHQADRHEIGTHLFINFIPVAVYDPVSCLRSTVQAIDNAGISHNQVVFEVIESNHPHDLNHLMLILKYYREAGFLVALDDFGAGCSSLNLLHQLRPDFIKLDMELIRSVHQDSYKALITEKILEIAQQLEIKTVAEGIESMEELQWVSERGVDYVQGQLIAYPSNPPTAFIPNFNLPSLINSLVNA